MDGAALKTLLKTTGYPVAHHHFEATPTRPHIVYLSNSSSNFAADNKVYQKETVYLVELYTDRKDPVAEKAIEDLFDANDIFWEKDEIWIGDENLYQVLYQI